ncbi:hypothetical protein [Frankia sp. Cr1]|uniref:hypothetical protein n=1 Tax=Frankia sp. Cr1 TaxID=3073931 RepID=UPI002AD38662|nr:hypothetical protein [Frankia sp. Cr1]
MSRHDPDLASDLDRLYALLPAIHRIRDVEFGEPLRALLQVINEQVEIVQGDIEALYDNWFIETCADWVVPYLGDLVGHVPLHPAADPGPQPGAGGSSSAQTTALTRAIASRTDVANTVHAHRRKGSLALLEQLAADVAGWPARAVEFAPLLGVSAPVRLFRPAAADNAWRIRRGRTADLRQGDALDRVDGPFDELAHTVTVSRPNAARRPRRYAIPSVALFVWRLRTYPVTNAPALCIDAARHHFTFSLLGNDTPLFARPAPEPDPTHIAAETNLPVPIRRRAFAERTADYYGLTRSLFIWRDAERRPVPLERIVPADLRDWAYRPQGEDVAVDPVLGRIAFSPRAAPESGVWVSYRYGFSDDLGGGEYERPLSPTAGAEVHRRVYRVGPGEQHQEIMGAVAAWQADKQADPNAVALRDAVIEITDSGAYQEPIEIILAYGERLELRAAQGRRPVLRLLNWYGNRPDSLRVRGPADHPESEAEAEAELAPASAPALDRGDQPPRLVLDGLLVSGRGILVSGTVEEVVVRHCTLVPGWSLGHDCEPEVGTEPSIELTGQVGCLRVERAILGTVRVSADERATDPMSICIADSILDATDDDQDALGAPDACHAYAVVTVRRTTVFGHIRVHAVELAENSIFTGPVRVVRRQVGCVRFCYVPPGSRTPVRYGCQPDGVRTAVDEAVRLGRLDATEATLARVREEGRVRPRFTSSRYGTPGHAQLAVGSAPEISTGADDESELGAFHDLFTAQRAANLRARLDQFVPAGTDAGIVVVT